MTAVRYTRKKHAAHNGFTQRPLWDLECWDVIQSYDSARPAEVPDDAARDYGYLDSTGQQHIVYRRHACVTELPSCPICKASTR